MKCPICGGAELINDTRDVPHVVRGKTYVIPAVTGEFCDACDESILGMVEVERVMRLMAEIRDRVDRLQRSGPP